MENHKKKFFYTIAFYALYITAAFIANGFYRGGPCSPGYGFFMLLLLLPLAFVLLLINLFLIYIGRSEWRPALWVHSAVIALFVAGVIVMFSSSD
jgi:glucan phosphoethanolaminetransferase (alkaline phosphatase superfamily)